jgi:hypothetical protein
MAEVVCPVREKPMINFSKRSKIGGFLLSLAVAASAGGASALTLNPDAGWSLFATNPSVGDATSTISFSLAQGGVFTIVDACHSGYAYELFDGGMSLGTTSTSGSWGISCNTDPSFADQHVADPAYDFGSFNFAAGSYDLTVKTIIDGGPGANRAFVRLDSVVPNVPLPAGMLLGGTALAALGLFGRRRKPAA